MTKTETAPGIGTPEGAVRACVALIASVTGQPEELTERYLDLYYQVRKAAEGRSFADAQDDRRAGAEGRSFAGAQDDKRAGAAAAGSTDCHTSAAAQPSFECRAARQDARNDGDAEKERPAAKTGPSEPRKKVDFEEVLASASAGAKMPGKPKPGPWSSVKREIRERFIKLRGEGMTLAQAVNLSDGKLNDGEVLVIMNGGKAEMRVYNALEDAMNKWEATVKAADKTDSTTE